MTRPFSAKRPIIMASMAGSFLGSAIWLGTAMLSGTFFFGGPAGIALGYLVAAAFITPIAALGIVLFGLPAAEAVGDSWRAWWVPIAAIVMGAIAGRILYSMLLFLLWQRLMPPGGFVWADPGVIIGASVGLAFWWFERQWRIVDGARRAAEGEWDERTGPDGDIL